ncbi:MAG: hypothetical protein RL535_554, partial [Pseudomonadota bacterium]
HNGGGIAVVRQTGSKNDDLAVGVATFATAAT